MGRGYFSFKGGLMGLIDDLNNSDNFGEPVRTKCKICELLKELEPEESKALKARLEDSKTGHTALSDVLIKNGFNISRSSVSRHRKEIHVAKR